MLAEPVHHGADLVPVTAADRLPPLVVEIDGVDQRAIDVQLELSGGGVPDPHRRGPEVTLEVGQLILGQVAAPVDAVHDLQRAGLLGAPHDPVLGDEAHERLGLRGEAQTEHGVDAEGRVTDPDVAVVPVALAADLLGKAGGRRGDDRAGGRVGEQLQDQG